MQGLTDSVEYQERAAIREFDGGLAKPKAELLATEDIAQRADQQLQKEPQLKTLQDYRDYRDQVGKAFRSEQDPERKARLFSKWMDLNGQILEIKKEVA